MHRLLNILSSLFLLLLFLAVISFSYFNGTPVALRFGTFEFPPLPIYVWVVGAFVAGGLLGLLVGLRVVTSWRNRLEHGRLKKQLEQAEQEVRQLRSMTLRDLD